MITYGAVLDWTKLTLGIELDLEGGIFILGLGFFVLFIAWGEAIQEEIDEMQKKRDEDEHRD